MNKYEKRDLWISHCVIMRENRGAINNSVLSSLIEAFPLFSLLGLEACPCRIHESAAVIKTMFGFPLNV